MRDILLLRFLFVNFCVHLSFSVHDSMNFVLQPMKRECFFEDFDKNSPARTVEAFVQSGGNLDVMLTVHGPLELDEIRLGNFEKSIMKERIDSTMESESETQTFVTALKPKIPGTYAICLDNRHSRFLSKTVELDVRIASRPEPLVLKLGGELSSEEPDEAMIRSKESLASIQKGLTKIFLEQQRDRHRLSLHSETNLMSHNRVVSGSLLETAVFIAAALFQIIFVRRWFASRTTINAKQRA